MERYYFLGMRISVLEFNFHCVFPWHSCISFCNFFSWTHNKTKWCVLEDIKYNHTTFPKVNFKNMRSCDWTLLNLVCFLSRRIVTGEFELWTSILSELLNKPIYSTLFSFSPLLDKRSWIKYTSYMPNCNPPYCHANTRKHLRDLRDKVESAQIPQ